MYGITILSRIYNLNIWSVFLYSPCCYVGYCLWCSYLLAGGRVVWPPEDILILMFSASTANFSSLLARSPSAEILTSDIWERTEARLPGVSFFTGVWKTKSCGWRFSSIHVCCRPTSGADRLPAPGIGSMMTSLNVLAISSLLLLEEANRHLDASPSFWSKVDWGAS